MKATTLRTIGIIVGAHGLQGEVAIKPWDEDAPWVDALTQVYVFKPKGPVEMMLHWTRHHGATVVAKFSDVNNRDEAERLKGLEVKAVESDLPPLEEGDYYADALIGLTVVSLDSGAVLGSVRDVLSSDAGDFLEVEAPGLSEPVLVPFRDIFVPQVDLAGKQIGLRGLDSLFAEPGAE